MTHDLFTYADSLPAHEKEGRIPEPPFQRHSKTSKAAAEAIKPRVGPMHDRILQYLRLLRKAGWEGGTDEQMQEALRIAQNTQRPRRRELQRWGYVIDGGTTRPTKSGRQAVVWVLAKEAGA